MAAAAFAVTANTPSTRSMAKSNSPSDAAQSGNTQIVIIDQKSGADLSTWLKPWKNASWSLLEKVRSGELCANLVKHDLARHYFDNSTVLVALQQKMGRKDYSGFCLATLHEAGVDQSCFLVIDIFCSKPGGGPHIARRSIRVCKKPRM